MNQETKDIIRAAHLLRAKDPLVIARLRALANNPKHNATRAAKMKAKWADPIFKAKMLAGIAARKQDSLAKVALKTEAKDKARADKQERDNAANALGKAGINVAAAGMTKKRIVTDAQKKKYAAARKTKRAAIKAKS